MRAPTRITCPQLQAEGSIIDPDCLDAPIPYRADLAGPDGVALHLWMGSCTDLAQRDHAIRIARHNRDVVGITYSDGQPVGFWQPRVDMGWGGCS